MCHSATRHEQHRNRVCVRAQPPRFLALVVAWHISLPLWHACVGELQPKGYGRYLWDVPCTSDVTPSETIVSGIDIIISSTNYFYIIALDHMSPSVLLLV